MSKISSLSALAAAAVIGTALFAAVDPADTSMAPTGTTKKVTASDVRKAIFSPTGAGWTNADPIVHGPGTVHGAFSPAADNTYALGTGAVRWADIKSVLGTFTTVAGTLSTAAQPNVTSLGTLAASLLFVDATHDIGASGATRPRDGYFSRNFVVGNDITQTAGTAALQALTATTATFSSTTTVSTTGAFRSVGTNNQTINAGASFTIMADAVHSLREVWLVEAQAVNVGITAYAFAFVRIDDNGVPFVVPIVSAGATSISLSGQNVQITNGSGTNYVYAYNYQRLV